MIKVIMMCGICGSGKTTYAKQKEKEGYVRLSYAASDENIKQVLQNLQQYVADLS